MNDLEQNEQDMLRDENELDELDGIAKRNDELRHDLRLIELQTLFAKASTALLKLSEHWDNELLDKDYPFDESFDEIALDFSEWASNRIDHINTQMKA